VDVRAEPPLSASRALVLGAGGQDGSYLCELLLGRGYDVVGVVPDAAATSPNLAGVAGELSLVDVDLLDLDAVESLLREHAPHELYNLAAPTFVPRSWDEPVATVRFVTVAITVVLEAVRVVDAAVRVFQASSAEVFGNPTEVPQTEATRRAPATPYGAAKAFADLAVDAYRRRYGLHASCGILYNHESPRRPPEFLPRKVARAAAAIARGDERELELGDLDAERDWGYAPDYVDAMWRMLQQDAPGDYVVATGVAHTVEELVATAFAHAGLDWHAHVRVDDSLRRREGLRGLVGDASRARTSLGWTPTVGFEELVGLLVDAELSSEGAT
jgi:GDPmannose 4,6-dehydratase